MALKLSSPAFQNRGTIPREFTAHGADKSPPLEWHRIPTGTKSLALIMEDRDARDKSFVHWVMFSIPATATKVAMNLAKKAQLPDGSRQGLNDSKNIGYNGPRPPVGKVHRYFFKLYALNVDVNLPAGTTTGEKLKKAMAGQILMSAELMGTFQATGAAPKPKKATKRKPRIPKWVATASGPSQAEKDAAAKLDQTADYIMRRDRLEQRLEAAYRAHPDAIEEFFKRFAFISAMSMKKVRLYVKGVAYQDLRLVLADYVKFASKFRVMFALRTGPLRFEAKVWPQYGDKFYVRYVTARKAGDKYVGEHLEPARRSVPPTDPYIDYFEDEEVTVTATVQKLIDDKKVSFVRVDDRRGGYSILKNLEAFAYRPDGVTIIEHHAEQPYFMCIFGQNIKKHLIGRVGTAFSKFQQEHYGRARSGRRMKIDELKKALQLKKTTLTNKAQAAALVPEGGDKPMKVQEVKLSKLEKKLRGL